MPAAAARSSAATPRPAWTSASCGATSRARVGPSRWSAVDDPCSPAAGSGTTRRWTPAARWSGATCAAAASRSCDLRQNHAGSAGGAIHALAAGLALHDCLLADNTAGVAGAALALDGAAARLVGCTLTGNRTEADGGVVLAIDAATLFDRCLIAFNGTAELAGEGPAWPQFLRSNLYGNLGPAWAGPLVDQRDRLGNRASDPLFCDRDRGDYRLRPGSPCLLADDAPIGAFGPGCGAP